MDPRVSRYPLLSSGQSYKLDRFLMQHPWAKSILGIMIACFLILSAYFIGKGLGTSSLEPFSMKDGPVKYIDKPGETIIKTIEVKVPGPSPPGHILSYTGTNGYLIGGWGDNLQWDGLKVQPIEGKVTVKVDPEHNIGSLIADLSHVSINSEDRTYLDGDVRIEFTIFQGIEDFKNGGIATDVELFGNSGREGDFLPRTKASLAGWGTADVLLDGQTVYSKLAAFFMINDGIRHEDNSIKLDDGTVYTPRFANKGGFSNPRQKEMTLMLQSNDGDKKNKPPVSVFIHVVFKDIEGEGITSKVPISSQRKKLNEPGQNISPRSSDEIASPINGSPT